jgi:hypothetical protein
VQNPSVNQPQNPQPQNPQPQNTQGQGGTPTSSAPATNAQGESLNEAKKIENCIIQISDSIKDSNLFNDVKFEASADKKEANIVFDCKILAKEPKESTPVESIKFGMGISAKLHMYQFNAINGQGIQGPKREFVPVKEGGKIIEKMQLVDNSIAQKAVSFLKGIWSKIANKDFPKPADTFQEFTEFLCANYGKIKPVKPGTDLDSSKKDGEESLNSSLKEKLNFAVSYNAAVNESDGTYVNISRNIECDKECADYYILSEAVWDDTRIADPKKELNANMRKLFRVHNDKDGIMEYAKEKQNANFGRYAKDSNYDIKKPYGINNIDNCALYECCVALRFNDEGYVSNAFNLGIQKITF